MPCSGSPITTPRQTRLRPPTACSRSNTPATGSPPAQPRRRGGVWARRPDGTWYLIRADAPSHAFNYQRRLLAGEPGHAGEGDCQVCPAEIPGNGGLPDMLRLAARLGADVTPRPVQTARLTMSRMPTCNRIVPGGYDFPPTTRAWQGFSPMCPAPRPERVYGSSLSRSSHRLAGQGWIPEHPLDMCEDLTCRISTGEHSADVLACFPS